MAKKEGSLVTHYEKEDAGHIVFKKRTDHAESLEKYIQLLSKLMESPKTDPSLLEGFKEIQTRFENLLYSTLPAEEVEKQIKTYSRVPLGDGKFMHLSSFLSGGDPKVIASPEAYLLEVQKMVKNTLSNLTNLLIFTEDGSKLTELMKGLQEVKALTDYQILREKMNALTQSGLLNYYNETKLSFLKSWIAPFQEKLNIPIEQMTPQEIQQALQQVDSLKKKQLSDIGLGLNNDENDRFRPFNREMDPFLNGSSVQFWGNIEFRDEFIELLKQAINRFSFKLENHFLIFETSSKEMVYLVGFPDAVFSEGANYKELKIALVPHLKVLFEDGSGNYKALTREAFEDMGEFYRQLKTATVPFLVSLSTTLGVELSPGIREAFDIWL